MYAEYSETTMKEAEELVVADVDGLHALGLAEVPLADHRGAVAVVAEQLGGGDLVGPRVLLDRVAGEDRPREAAADRQAAGIDCGAGRRAGRLRVRRREAQAAAGEASMCGVGEPTLTPPP